MAQSETLDSDSDTTVVTTNCMHERVKSDPDDNGSFTTELKCHYCLLIFQLQTKQLRMTKMKLSWSKIGTCGWYVILSVLQRLVLWFTLVLTILQFNNLCLKGWESCYFDNTVKRLHRVSWSIWDMNTQEQSVFCFLLKWTVVFQLLQQKVVPLWLHLCQ